jgi:hypothetical protein
LESDFGQHHRATPKHLVAHSIQRLAVTTCSSM